MEAEARNSAPFSAQQVKIEMSALSIRLTDERPRRYVYKGGDNISRGSKDWCRGPACHIRRCGALGLERQ